MFTLLLFSGRLYFQGWGSVAVLHWHTAVVQQGKLMTSIRRISDIGKVQKGKSNKRIEKSEVDISSNAKDLTLKSEIGQLCFLLI